MNTQQPTPVEFQKMARQAQELGFINHLRQRGYTDPVIKSAHQRYTNQLNQRDQNVAQVVQALGFGHILG